LKSVLKIDEATFLVIRCRNELIIGLIMYLTNKFMLFF